jgi:hypothetical protein
VVATGHAPSTPPAPAVNEDFLFKKADDPSSLSTAPTQLPYSSRSIPEAARNSLRTQRFDKALDFLSTHIGRGHSKKDSLQVRSSAWIYLFDLATRPEQLERASGKFSEFVESGRQFRDQDVTAFVRA